MPTYLLQGLPHDVWENFKSRSEREGWPLEALLIQLVRDYSAGRINVTRRPPVASSTAGLLVECREGHGVSERALRAAVLEVPHFDLTHMTCPTCGDRFRLGDYDRDRLKLWAQRRRPRRGDSLVLQPSDGGVRIEGSETEGR